MTTHFKYEPHFNGSKYLDSTENIPEGMVTYSCICPRSTGKYISKTRLIQHIRREGHKSWVSSLNDEIATPSADPEEPADLEEPADPEEPEDPEESEDPEELEKFREELDELQLKTNILNVRMNKVDTELLYHKNVLLFLAVGGASLVISNLIRLERAICV